MTRVILKVLEGRETVTTKVWFELVEDTRSSPSSPGVVLELPKGCLLSPRTGTQSLESKKIKDKIYRDSGKKGILVEF